MVEDWLRAFLFFFFFSMCNQLGYIRHAPASLHIHVHVNGLPWPDAPMFASFLACLAAYCKYNYSF